MDGLKDLLVQIRYQGDIGHLFINGTMVNDNFCNGDVWEFGVRTFEEELKEHPLTLTITPLSGGECQRGICNGSPHGECRGIHWGIGACGIMPGV